MSETRRPDLIFTIGRRRRKDGRIRNWKVELYRTTQWPDMDFRTPRGRLCRRQHHRFRLRVGGRWFWYSKRDEETGEMKPTEDPLAVTASEFRDLLWRSISKVWRA